MVNKTEMMSLPLWTFQSSVITGIIILISQGPQPSFYRVKKAPKAPKAGCDNVRIQKLDLPNLESHPISNRHASFCL